MFLFHSRVLIVPAVYHKQLLTFIFLVVVFIGCWLVVCVLIAGTGCAYLLFATRIWMRAGHRYVCVGIQVVLCFGRWYDAQIIGLGSLSYVPVTCYPLSLFGIIGVGFCAQGWRFGLGACAAVCCFGRRNEVAQQHRGWSGCWRGGLELGVGAEKIACADGLWELGSKLDLPCVPESDWRCADRHVARWSYNKMWMHPRICVGAHNVHLPQCSITCPLHRQKYKYVIVTCSIATPWSLHLHMGWRTQRSMFKAHDLWTHRSSAT